jgi:hypothetical protein
MTTLVLQAVRDTLGTLLADPTYLGAQPGILMALHTWSQTLVLHPHVHCLVTGGGVVYLQSAANSLPPKTGYNAPWITPYEGGTP